MRLIDAVRLANDIIQVRDNDLHSDYPNSFERGVIRKVLRCVEESPTINPEDLRPKGRWIYLGESLFDTVYKCSECGHPEKMSKKCKKKYFHNCGAQMEE